MAIAIVLMVSFIPQSIGQNSYEPLGSPNATTVERAIILNGIPGSLHTAIFPYRRGDMAEIAEIDGDIKEQRQADPDPSKELEHRQSGVQLGIYDA